MNFPRSTLKELVTRIRDKQILDVGGAGQGSKADSENWLFGILEKNAASITGVDVTPCDHPMVLLGNVETLNLGREFDVITMFDVIEHLDNVGVALSNLKKHLKPGGELIITTPNMGSIGPIMDTVLFRGVRSNPTHTIGFNSRMLKYTLRRHGFAIKKFSYVHFPLFGNHKRFKKIFAALRGITTYPIHLLWREFSATLLVVAVPGRNKPLADKN